MLLVIMTRGARIVATVRKSQSNSILCTSTSLYANLEMENVENPIVVTQFYNSNKEKNHYYF